MKRFVSTLVLVILAVGALTVAVDGADNKKGYPVVVLETSKGNIEIELYPDKAPLSVQNFLWYVDNKFYDGLIFHRVIKTFMIQGGGFTPDMTQKAGKPPIDNEAGNGLTNDKYTVAMARTNAVHSATSQFFINTVDNDFLNHRDNTQTGFGYCVFGKVVAGQEAVDAIAAVPTGSKAGFQDVPVETVAITKAYRKDGAKAAEKK
ncbi:MAG TPA: peptidylprolyl isomerase [Candidatus Krumholzibacteria bacterium]|nr:peptidylprolyl isomerase [Candidatus Krumholzibacteria bacterium]